MTDFDILVTGGGPAGAAAAALMARDGRRVALLDIRRPPAAGPELDPRVVAVSPGSRRVFEAARAWRRVPADRLTGYGTMEVHDGEHALIFRAAEHGLEELGWIAELPALQRALWEQLGQAGAVELITGAGVTAMDPDESVVHVGLNDGRRLSARLLVAADGACSPLRDMAGIGCRTWHYNQHALVCHLTTARPNPGIAWQRFTDGGPLALLPLPGGRSSLVWSVPTERARALAGRPDEQLAEILDSATGRPFGAVTDMTRRLHFPLVRRRAEILYSGRLALIGDAARTVHPLAGQGMNLGLMDAAALAEILADWRPDTDPETALTRYSRWRTGAGEAMAAIIHGLNELQAGGLPVPAALRRLGLGAVGQAWPVREMLVRRACGLDADSPRPARH